MPSYPSPEQILVAANLVRVAGGGDLLDALVPSTPAKANACLIANALNFDCEVRRAATWDSGEWAMKVRGRDLAEKIGQALDQPVACLLYPDYEVRLPNFLKLAAWEFDSLARRIRDNQQLPGDAAHPYRPFLDIPGGAR